QHRARPRCHINQIVCAGLLRAADIAQDIDAGLFQQVTGRCYAVEFTDAFNPDEPAVIAGPSESDAGECAYDSAVVACHSFKAKTAVSPERNRLFLCQHLGLCALPKVDGFDPNFFEGSNAEAGIGARRCGAAKIDPGQVAEL